MEKITVLKGPDRVRKRPAVIFGSDGIEGVKNAVLPILELYATEAQLGCCRHIRVIHNGPEITLMGDDRGIRLGGDDGEAWKQIFEELPAAPRSLTEAGDFCFTLPTISHSALFGQAPDGKAERLPRELGWLDLCAAQYASACMDVTAVRDGREYSLRFQKGRNLGGLQIAQTQAPSGTRFHFAMDPAVFTDTEIPEPFFIEALTDFAILIPGLLCEYQNEGTKTQVKLCYPGGIAAFVQKNGDMGPLPACTAEISAEGRDRYTRPLYRARLALAIGFSQRGGARLCLHNFRRLPFGGAHMQWALEKACRIVNDCFRSRILPFGGEITCEELCRYLHIVIATWCDPCATMWENGARQAICNPMIADMAYDAVAERFSAYVFDNRHDLEPIIDRILSNRKLPGGE